MMRRTTLWEDLGLGVLAGATIVLTSAIWVLLTSERGVLMNRIGPSTSDLYVAAICPEMKSRLESRPETNYGTEDRS
jgi:hypothetical protein